MRVFFISAHIKENLASLFVTHAEINVVACMPTDDEDEVLEDQSSEMDEYVSPAQLDEQLVTLSLLPDSRWKNLLHLDIIKVRVCVL